MDIRTVSPSMVAAARGGGWAELSNESHFSEGFLTRTPGLALAGVGALTEKVQKLDDEHKLLLGMVRLLRGFTEFHR